MLHNAPMSDVYTSKPFMNKSEIRTRSHTVRNAYRNPDPAIVICELLDGGVVHSHVLQALDDAVKDMCTLSTKKNSHPVDVDQQHFLCMQLLREHPFMDHTCRDKNIRFHVGTKHGLFTKTLSFNLHEGDTVQALWFIPLDHTLGISTRNQNSFDNSKSHTSSPVYCSWIKWTEDHDHAGVCLLKGMKIHGNGRYIIVSVSGMSANKLRHAGESTPPRTPRHMSAIRSISNAPNNVDWENSIDVSPIIANEDLDRVIRVVTKNNVSYMLRRAVRSDIFNSDLSLRGKTLREAIPMDTPAIPRTSPSKTNPLVHNGGKMDASIYLQWIDWHRQVHYTRT